MALRKTESFGRKIKSLLVVIIVLIVFTNLSSTIVLRWTANGEKTQSTSRLAQILAQFEQSEPWHLLHMENGDSLLAGQQKRMGALGLWMAVEVDTLPEGRALVTSLIKSRDDMPPFLGSGGHRLIVPAAEHLVRVDGIPIRAAERARNIIGGRIRYGVIVSAQTEGALRDLSRADLVLRGVILIAFGVFAFLFYRTIFLPYRDMRRQAQELADTGLLPENSADDAEFVMQTFARAVRRLSKQKEHLQEQYDQSERRARDLQRFNDYILRSLTTGVLIFDKDGRIVRINRSAQQILNMDPEQWLGSDIAALRIPYAGLADVVTAGLQGGRLSSRDELEITLPIDSGRQVHLGVSTSHIYNDQGTAVGLTVLLSDLTEIKRLYTQLAENQRMADLGELTAGLAHQLRNSLAALVGYGRLLAKKCQLDERGHEWIAGLMSEAKETEAMVEHFLQFARPLRGELIAASLTDILRGAFETAKARAEQFGVSLEWSGELSPEDSRDCDDTVHAEPLMLKQVFINLLINAVEAVGDHGRVSLEVTRPQMKSAVPLWCIDVRDDGPGIPDQDRERIFHPFQTTKESGTGLGLALARKLVGFHRGNLQLIASEPGKTIFRVTLPAAVNELRQTEDDALRDSHTVTLIGDPRGRNGYVPYVRA